MPTLPTLQLPITFGHPRSGWRVPLALLGGVVLVSSCLNDRTVGPSGELATLTLGATIRGTFQVAQRPELIVVVGYNRGNESFAVLRQARLALDSGATAYALQVDVLPCLRDSLRFDPGQPFCRVFVQTELRFGETVIDQRQSGPYDLVAGRKVRAAPVELFVGVTAPTVTLPSPAVLVDSTLIRYEVDAADADGNLSFLYAQYQDSLSGAFQFLYHDFGVPGAAFVGPLYGFLSQAQTRVIAPRLDVTVYDTKGASGAATTSVVVPSATSAPRASGVSGSVTSSGATVTFTIDDPDANVESVEILFRDPALGPLNPNSDELLGRCTATIPTGNGAKSVSCASFGAVSAQAIVIPIDRTGNVGFAARGPVSPPGR